MASSLEGCVSSLRNSMQLLDQSISILDSGVSDFPRLSKTLQTTRHFELISEPDLQSAQSALLSEIRPEVENLLGRVSNYLDKLERREQALIAKCDLNEGRLSRDSTSASTFRPSSRASQKISTVESGGKPISALQELKYKQLRAKKDRLSYAVETLELQAKQRERQLRMSMAAPQHFYDD
ncbi:DASH complex, subunit Spc19 [Polyplosphaeria fusca]|uniref:DASH complex subunit SPC19 n=1 Tax=Polyplosphaeria fusca TaxID=682080 RepID=A0A9P4R9I4_9PLEO|nr:DASH complex, subunit Spc19 [Polyplosphaeria fusca]